MHGGKCGREMQMRDPLPLANPVNFNNPRVPLWGGEQAGLQLGLQLAKLRVSVLGLQLGLAC